MGPCGEPVGSCVGELASHIVLRNGVCGIGQVSECVCRGVGTGVGLCECVFQRHRQGRKVCCGPGRCARGRGPVSYIVSVPGPSEPSANAGAHPPLPLSAPQMGIVCLG